MKPESQYNRNFLVGYFCRFLYVFFFSLCLFSANFFKKLITIYYSFVKFFIVQIVFAESLSINLIFTFRYKAGIKWEKLRNWNFFDIHHNIHNKSVAFFFFVYLNVAEYLKVNNELIINCTDRNMYLKNQKWTVQQILSS